MTLEQAAASSATVGQTRVYALISESSTPGSRTPRSPLLARTCREYGRGLQLRTGMLWDSRAGAEARYSDPANASGASRFRNRGCSLDVRPEVGEVVGTRRGSRLKSCSDPWDRIHGAGLAAVHDCFEYLFVLPWIVLAEFPHEPACTGFLDATIDEYSHTLVENCLRQTDRLSVQCGSIGIFFPSFTLLLGLRRCCAGGCVVSASLPRGAF